MARPALQKSLHVERRLFHLFAGSSLPVLGLLLSREIALAVYGGLAAFAVAVEATRFSMPGLNGFLVSRFGRLLRQGEEGQVTGATYMILAALLAFYIYKPHIAVPGLFFASVGDPAAAIVGLRWGRRRLWDKSLEGAIAFLLVSLAMAGVLLVVLEGASWWAMAVGAGIAALVELLPLRLNDNVTIPVLSGGAMALADRLGL